jgi:hypothetical protein
MLQKVKDNVDRRYRISDIQIMRTEERLVFAGTSLDTYVTQKINRHLISPTNNIPCIVCTRLYVIFVSNYTSFQCFISYRPCICQNTVSSRSSLFILYSIFYRNSLSSQEMPVYLLCNYVTMMHGQQNIKFITDVLSFQPTKLSQFL